MTEYYCVLEKDPLRPLERTAEFLSSVLKVDLREAELAARKNPGFLLENAPLEAASAFERGASAFGLGTILVSQNGLERPAEPLPVTKIEPSGSGFYYVTGPVREYVAFETVRCLSAGAFQLELPPADPGTDLKDQLSSLALSLRARFFPALPLPAGRSDAAGVKPAQPRLETVFSADILAGGRRLSLSAGQLDYSGLGPAKTFSSFENFRTLLAELAALCPAAVKNSFLVAFIRKTQLAGLRHFSKAAYEKELVWLSTLACRGAKGG